MTKDVRNTPLNRAAAMAFVLGCSVALQGCVAAAFPLAAGGLLGERSISARKGDAAKPDPIVEVAEASQASEIANSDLAPVDERTTTTSPPATSASADFNAAFANRAEANNAVSPIPVSVGPVSAGPGSSERALAALPANPAPIERPANRVIRPLPTPVPSSREPLDAPAGGLVASPLSGPVSSPASAPSNTPADTPAGQPAFASSSPLGVQAGINQFLSYANQRQIGSGDEPEAAMLSNRVTLEPVKAQCGGVSPTVLIDLDPEGALFDSTSASRPPSGLARGLSQLRLSGVSIAWISGNGIDKLDAISRALRYSGLDLNNEDRVLLVRSPDDRKQALREELSEISCLIAIAGDTRSDFDELYDYLKNPADAGSLEPLIGDGWFLIAQPLL